jgi:hypothetical protein
MLMEHKADGIVVVRGFRAHVRAILENRLFGERGGKGGTSRACRLGTRAKAVSLNIKRKRRPWQILESHNFLPISRFKVV